MCGILLVAEAGEQTHPQAKVGNRSAVIQRSSCVCLVVLTSYAFVAQVTSFAAGLRARGPDHFGTVQV